MSRNYKILTFSILSFVYIIYGVFMFRELWIYEIYKGGSSPIENIYNFIFPLIALFILGKLIINKHFIWGIIFIILAFVSFFIFYGLIFGFELHGIGA